MPPLPFSTAAPTSASDAELAARAARGDIDAFQQIMRRHNRLLFRTGRSILKNDEETQDALQEAYLRAWRSLSGFRAEARLSTWLVRIVVNEALGRLRRSAGAQVVPLDAATDLCEAQGETWMHADADEQPERVAMRGEMRRLIESGIDALPEAFRTVFVLRAVEDMSNEEVAAALAIPEATVRSRFFRARGLLRESLSREVDVALSDAFAFDGIRCDAIIARVMAGIGQAGVAR
ncbi:RNA polymerase sigma factor [Variovorax sp. CF079]|uniref:RNA polymerase sigma factor n=1 Tax=Variovorax sp. CF079 TaxID=1882774 RepID=UPI000B833999|nr:RNA polymerase sigma factor [Variovorax sp. CF079]